MSGSSWKPLTTVSFLPLPVAPSRRTNLMPFRLNDSMRSASASCQAEKMTILASESRLMNEVRQQSQAPCVAEERNAPAQELDVLRDEVGFGGERRRRLDFADLLHAEAVNLGKFWRFDIEAVRHAVRIEILLGLLRRRVCIR